MASPTKPIELDEHSEYHYYSISVSLFPNSSTANSYLSAGPSELLLLYRIFGRAVDHIWYIAPHMGSNCDY